MRLNDGAADHGASAGAPPFIAMGLIPGECVEPVLAESRDPARFAEIRVRALDAARALAALHSVEPAQAGLGDEPVVTLADEIDRWTRAFTTVPPDLQGEYERCARALHATIPAGVPPVVNHGDYRLGNTLCAGGTVTAIIDWEIWSVGDPRIDLSWFTFFTDEAKHPAMPSPEPTGMPTAAELLAAYGRDLPDLPWFDALTRYKEAGASALLIKRGRKTGEMPGLVRQMTPALPVLLREAEELLSWTARRTGGRSHSYLQEYLCVISPNKEGLWQTKYWWSTPTGSRSSPSTGRTRGMPSTTRCRSAWRTRSQSLTNATT